MFINLENGKLKLYDLKIYKKIDKLIFKIIFDSPYEHQTIESTENYYDGKLLNDFNMVYFVSSIDTKVRHKINDFYYPDEILYRYTFNLYHLPQFYPLIKGLKEEDVNVLQELNKYINNEFYGEEQELFNKYRKQILNSFKLIELVDEDYLNLLEVYNLLLNNSKGKLKDNLNDIKNYLNIHKLNIDSIPKLIKDSKSY